MQYYLRQLFILFLSFYISLNVNAQTNDVKLIMADIAKKKATPALLNRSITQGKERAVLCNQCHGVDGNSKKPEVPNLAGQNPVYLLDQIEKFADGRRINYVMNALSKNFTRDDKVNLAIFYASLKVKTVKQDPKLVAQGKPVYETRCVSCHGAAGAGQADFARLAGQQKQYVENTLFKFKMRTKDSKAKRSSDIMEAISNALSNEDIIAVSAYIAQLK